MLERCTLGLLASLGSPPYNILIGHKDEILQGFCSALKFFFHVIGPHSMFNHILQFAIDIGNSAYRCGKKHFSENFNNKLFSRVKILKYNYSRKNLQIPKII